MIIINEITGIKTDARYQNMLPKKVYKAFKKMQKAALKKGYKIFIDSSYRSYEYQEKVFNKLVQDNKERAMLYCGLPGYSEHQTGLAIDIIYMKNNVLIENTLVDDSEIIWCQKHSYKYGFILRYPKDKKDITGYEYEPWHFRYVGKKLAKYLTKNGLTLEEYHQNCVEF